VSAQGPSKFLARVAPEEARRRLLDGVDALAAELVPVEAACGRVTASAVYAAHDAPHYRAAAMDGIAVRAAQTLPASPEAPLLLGTAPGAEPRAAEIDTGGLLPDWADAVIRIEDVQRRGDGFEIRGGVAPMRNVRRAGEDIDKGTRLLPRGARVTAWDLGALIAAGIVELDVVRRPRLAILATGSEVIEPVADPKPGQVLEYNGRMLEAAATQWGAEVRRLGIIGDDLERLTASVRAAAADCDALAIIAGSSVGRKDLTVEVLGAVGEILAHGIDMMPGKPATVARVGTTPVVGIPGYPVSAIVAAEELLRPLLARLGGRTDPGPDRATARVGRKIPSRLGVEEFRRVCLCRGQEGYVVAPLPRGAGAVSTAARAHGWLRIGPRTEGVDAGAEVRVDLIRPLAEADDTVILAGPADAWTAAIEDRLRSQGASLALVWLDQGDEDAIEAMAAGEAHAAVLPDEPATLERLAGRLAGAAVFRLVEGRVLALAPSTAGLPGPGLLASGLPAR
jgi:putative molybdopterin biosynthesis protein